VVEHGTGKRVVLIVGIAAAVLMLLFPPWRTPEGRSLGYELLFSPPVYTEMTAPAVPAVEAKYEGGGLRRDPLTGRQEVQPERLVSEGRPWSPPQFEDRVGLIAWGRMLSQWMVLAVVAVAGWLLAPRGARQ